MDRNKLEKILYAVLALFFIILGVLYATSVISKAAWSVIFLVITLLSIVFKVCFRKKKQ